MKKKFKRLSVGIAAFALAIGGILANIRLANATVGSLTFIFVLPEAAQEAGLELHAYNSNGTTPLELNTHGVHLGVIAPDLEQESEPSRFILRPSYKDHESDPMGIDSFDAVCTSATTCTLTIQTFPEMVDNGYGIVFTRPGNADFEFANEDGSYLDFTTMNLLEDKTIQIRPRSDEPGPGPDFDGTAWFVWNCADGQICRYQLTELEPAILHEDEDHRVTEIEYITKYVPAASVIDVDAKATLNINALLSLVKLSIGSEPFENYYFVWSGQIDRISALTTWSAFKDYWAENFLGEEHYDDLRAFAIDPTGASDGNNIISTNGDRTFRATLYDAEDYYGITNASKPSDLTYYPSFWDVTFFNPAIDISDTSLENPAVLLSYLLEPTVILESDSVSSAISSIEIADGTPAGAVTITKDGGKFTLTFNSNYYDKVTFKVTSSDGKTYYLMIGRIAIDRNGSLYVPTGDTSEYEVRAHVTTLDGTEYDFLLERAAEDDDNGGQNLELRAYSISDADVEKIVMAENDPKSPVKAVFTVTKTGSTSTHFAGALAGSGKGTGYIFERGNPTFDTGLSL